MAKIGRARRANRVITQAIEPLESRVLLSTVVVNTTIDGLFPPSTGIVSLRNAVTTANSSSSPTTVTFDPTVFAGPQTITLNGTDLTLSEPITIVGPSVGLTINGDQLGAVIQNTDWANISGVTITNGSNAGIQNTNNATLTLSRSTISGNSGGGIFNSGTATLTDVIVSGNPGGTFGGIENFVYPSNITVTNSTISNNGGAAGGLYNVGGTATLTNVAISGNTSSGYGAGGIYNAAGPVSLANVTISANVSSAYPGGGITNSGTLTVTNSTVAGNRATSAGGILNTHTTTISNSIVAGNTVQGAALTGPDASGSFNSLGYNLIGATDGSTGWNVYDLTGTEAKPLDPKLSPLGNYGGPTQTMALLAGSPALNAGWSALAVDANDNPLTTDQRGLPRIYGPSVDIGAYESQPPALPGDVNHDGTVNLADLLLLTRDFGKSTPMYEGGDLDGDGSVGISDFLMLVRNFGKGSASAAPALASPASDQSGIDRSRRRLGA